MKTIHAAMIEDDYLAAATDDPQGASPDYWPDLRYEPGFRIAKLVNVPAALAERLVRHGTDRQEFMDGYHAAYTALPFETKEDRP